MVRICSRVGSAFGAAALVASSVASATSASVGASGGISLELHRIPDSGQRHETYQRRRLHGQGEDFEVVPLNPGMGTHYAWVYAGTPPQRASVITDTGSSIMAFPCSGCEGCGTHTDQPFSAIKSTTLTHVTCSNPSFFRCQGCVGAEDMDKKTCDISQAYMEGSSWHATVVEDIVYLGGEASGNNTAMRDTYGTHFKFGCQNSETGLFITQVADGIMGLANNDNHLVAKLYREKKIPNKLFALCFAQEGGAMSIGMPDASRHKGNITYAKLKPSSGFYGVELRDVRIAGTSIEPSPTSLSFGQYIVDSGTTDSYLPSSMKAKFQEAFKKFSGLDYHTSSSACLGYTEKDLEKLPNVEFILGAEDGGNLTLVVPPEQYLLREESGKYCSSIFLSEGSGGVIGANIMMDHDVIFDQGNQRVGFVEADCEYRRLPASSSAPSTANLTTNAAVETTAPASTQAEATHAPTEEPAPTKESPSLSPVSPTPAPSSATPKPTEPATTQPQTTAPTPEPTPAPTVATPAPTGTSAAAIKTPTPTTAAAVSDAGTKSTSLNTSKAGEDDHPVVLTIVGTALAVAFIVIAAFSLRRRKKNKRDQKWSRVNETEGDDDDDDDDEEELIVHTPGQKSKAKKAPVRSDELDDNDEDDDDDSDDNNVRRDDQLSSNDDDDDDDDEIFDRDVEEGHKHSHDAKVLERL